jgi:hypothetical protein
LTKAKNLLSREYAESHFKGELSRSRTIHSGTPSAESLIQATPSSANH